MTDFPTTDESARADAPATPDGVTAGGPGDVRADHVELTQGGANNIDAQTVSIEQGGAGSVRAREVTINQSGIGVARTQRLEIRDSGAFAVVADEATVSDGANVFMLLARNTAGTVRPVVDWRAAAAFGAAFAVVSSLLRRR